MTVLTRSFRRPVSSRAGSRAESAPRTMRAHLPHESLKATAQDNHHHRRQAPPHPLLPDRSKPHGQKAQPRQPGKRHPGRPRHHHAQRLGLLPPSALGPKRHREYPIPCNPPCRNLTDEQQARPAHYVVIHNGIGLNVTQVETLTHKLSYLYERATKAVSYCTPTYYADLLCARARLWLMKCLSTRGKPAGAKFDFGGRDVPWKNGVHKK